MEFGIGVTYTGLVFLKSEVNLCIFYMGNQHVNVLNKLTPLNKKKLLLESLHYFPTPLTLFLYAGISQQAGESIFSSNCMQKCTCGDLGKLTCVNSSCQIDTCALKDGHRACESMERLEGGCRLTPGAQLSSFDGASGKYFCDGVYDLASVCDESAPFWFRVSVSIGKDNGDGLVAGRAVYVFFPDASITVKKNNRTWVSRVQDGVCHGEKYI